MLSWLFLFSFSFANQRSCGIRTKELFVLYLVFVSCKLSMVLAPVLSQLWDAKLVSALSRALAGRVSFLLLSAIDVLLHLLLRTTHNLDRGRSRKLRVLPSGFSGLTEWLKG